MVEVVVDLVDDEVARREVEADTVGVDPGLLAGRPATDVLHPVGPQVGRPEAGPAGTAVGAVELASASSRPSAGAFSR